MSNAPIRNKIIKEEDFDKFDILTLIAEYGNPDNTGFVVLFIGYDFFMDETFFIVRSSQKGIVKELQFKYLFNAIKYYNSFIMKGE